MNTIIIQKFIAVLSTLTAVCTAALSIAGLLLFLPRMFALKPYIVMSGSMEPAVHTGAIAYVSTKDDAVTVGDVITYKIADRLITHRVIRINGQQIYTKGDANTQKDVVPVHEEQIIGKVRMSLPYLGYLADFIQTGQGMAALVFLLLLHMLLRDIRHETDTILISKTGNIQKGERNIREKKYEME